MLNNNESSKIKRSENEINITPSNFTRTLIWLHGFSENSDAYLQTFSDSQLSLVPEDFKVRMLNAPSIPITFYKGEKHRAWFDLLALEKDNVSVDFEDLQNTSKYISRCLDEELDILNGDASRLYIGGFSQGCVMALHCGLTYKEKLGGIIGISGHLLEKTQLPEKQAPVFLSHGEEDDVIGIDYAVKSY